MGAMAAWRLAARGADVTVLHRRPNELSGGQRQRIAIARAMAASPDVLICDEVTSALDPDTARKVMSILRGISEHQGTTLMIITHDHDLAEEFCDASLQLADGTLTPLE